MLEIDAPAVNVNLRRPRGPHIPLRTYRAHEARARARLRRRRQPALDVPAAPGVARQIEAGARKRNGAELEPPGEQRRPAQAGRESVRPQEIFVAELRIVRNGDLMGFDARAVEQAELEPGNLDGSAETGREVGNEIAARGAGAQHAGK